MNILILSQYYPPEIGAPQARLSELAKRIICYGHQVSVLTAMPNYPIGRIHNGYRGIYTTEQIDGIKVYRTFIYPTQRTNFLHRLTNYFSFVISSSVIGSFVLPEFDFIMVESPPLFLGLSALWLSYIKKAQLIFNVSDLWPESAVVLGVLNRNSFSYRVSSYLDKLFYRKSWLVTGQSKSILHDIATRFPQCQVYHLSNGVDTCLFHSDTKNEEAKKKLSANDKTVILYAGLHGLAQGLDQVIDAAIEFAENQEIHFVFVGDGPEKKKLQKRVVDLGLKNVLFIPPMPRAEIPEILASADIAIVPLKKHLIGAVPSKIYEAMASSVPIILLAEGEAAEIVENYEAGIVVSFGDIAGLVTSIHNLANHAHLRQKMGSNGRKAAELYFDRDHIVKDFVKHLEQSIHHVRTP